MTGTKKGPHFGGGNGNTKLVPTIANAVRRARLDYEGFRRVSALVRKELGMRRRHGSPSCRAFCRRPASRSSKK